MPPTPRGNPFLLFARHSRFASFPELNLNIPGTLIPPKRQPYECPPAIPLPMTLTVVPPLRGPREGENRKKKTDNSTLVSPFGSPRFCAT